MADSRRPETVIDDLDKRILDLIQSGFPLAPCPYKVVAEQVGADEDEVLDRVERLRESGVIRRMGASFQSRKLGFKSTLCAAKVPEDRLDGFVAEVNRHPGVTHNYLRQNEFNVWFTCIGPSWEAVRTVLDEIAANTGIEVLDFPATRMFKIKVDFDMKSGERAEDDGSSQEMEYDTARDA